MKPVYEPNLEPSSDQRKQRKRVLLLGSQHAGAGRAHALLQEGKKKLWGWPTELRYFRSIGELRSICEALDPEKDQAICLVSGDGTVHQALGSLPIARFPQLSRSPVPLAVIPAGTANDLAGELGSRADWEELQELLDHHLVEQIDIIEVNRTPYVTVAGIGVGAFLTHEYNRRRKSSAYFRQLARLLRSHVYTELTLKTILGRRDYLHHVRVEVSSPGRKREVHQVWTGAIFIANQSQLGSSMTVAPGARNDDRRLHVHIVRASSRAELIRSLVQIKRGVVPDRSLVFSADELVIEDLEQRSIPIFADGEPLTPSKRHHFRVLPAALSVYSPRKIRGRS